MSEETKPNCYNCQWRGPVAGSAHSSCTFISEAAKESPMSKTVELLIAAGLQEIQVDGEVSPVFHETGKKKGWAMWPINFDPVWLISCKFFKKKEDAST